MISRTSTGCVIDPSWSYFAFARIQRIVIVRRFIHCPVRTLKVAERKILVTRTDGERNQAIYFAGIIGTSWKSFEAFVQRKIVTNGILRTLVSCRLKRRLDAYFPLRWCCAKIRIGIDDPLIDLIQCHSLRSRTLDGLSNQCDITVRRLEMNIIVHSGRGHFDFGCFDLRRKMTCDGQCLFARWRRRILSDLHVRQPFDRG